MEPAIVDNEKVDDRSQFPTAEAISTEKISVQVFTAEDLEDL